MARKGLQQGRKPLDQRWIPGNFNDVLNMLVFGGRSKVRVRVLSPMCSRHWRPHLGSQLSPTCWMRDGQGFSKNPNAMDPAYGLQTRGCSFVARSNLMSIVSTALPSLLVLFDHLSIGDQPSCCTSQQSCSCTPGLQMLLGR